MTETKKPSLSFANLPIACYLFLFLDKVHSIPTWEPLHSTLKSQHKCSSLPWKFLQLYSLSSAVPKNGPGLDATLFNTLLLPQNTEVVYLSHLFQKPISHHPFYPTLHSSGIVSWSFKCSTIFFYGSSYTTFLISGFPSFQSSVPQDESQTAYFLKLSSVRSIFPCKSKLISVFSSLSL